MATTASCARSPAVPDKLCVLPTRVVVALNSSGTGSEAVTFSPAFDNIPIVYVVPPLAQGGGGGGGTFAAGSITKSGFTLTVTTCTNITGGSAANCEVVFGAHEYL